MGIPPEPPEAQRVLLCVGRPDRLDAVAGLLGSGEQFGPGLGVPDQVHQRPHVVTGAMRVGEIPNLGEEVAEASTL